MRQAFDYSCTKLLHLDSINVVRDGHQLRLGFVPLLLAVLPHPPFLKREDENKHRARQPSFPLRSVLHPDAGWGAASKGRRRYWLYDGRNLQSERFSFIYLHMYTPVLSIVS